MVDFSIGRRAPLLVLLLLPALVLTSACSSAEPGAGASTSSAEPGAETSTSSSSSSSDAFAAKYAELREQGKSHKAATELAKMHVGGSIGSDQAEDTGVERTMDAVVVLAKFSAPDSYEAVRREQAVEELKIRFQSRDLDADRALGLLDKIAPEASINERRAAADNLARLSRADDWDGGNAIEATAELTRLITGNAPDAKKRIEAANELARRSKAGDLEPDDALNLMNDIAPGMSIEERREAAMNLVRLSKSEKWDAETTKQAAEETFQLVTGGELEYEKRRDAAVDLTGEAIKKFGGDEFEDEDVDVAAEMIKQTLSGDLDSDSVSDLLNSK